MKPPRFKKNPDGSFTRLTEEDVHRAATHELKARNHMRSAAQILGEEPAKTAAPKSSPSGPVKELDPTETARYLGMNLHEFQRIRYADPTFPKPREYTQLYKSSDLDDWKRRLNP